MSACHLTADAMRAVGLLHLFYCSPLAASLFSAFSAQIYFFLVLGGLLTFSWSLGASHPKMSGCARHARACGGWLSPRPPTTRMTPTLLQHRSVTTGAAVSEPTNCLRTHVRANGTPQSLYTLISLSKPELWPAVGTPYPSPRAIAACCCAAEGIASILPLLSWPDLVESSEDMLNVDRER